MERKFDRGVARIAIKVRAPFDPIHLKLLREVRTDCDAPTLPFTNRIIDDGVSSVRSKASGLFPPTIESSDRAANPTPACGGRIGEGDDLV